MSRSVIYRFQPSIQNPHVRGWGGSTLTERGQLFWLTAGVAMMTLMYNEFLGTILAPYFGFWFPLWIAWGGYACRHHSRLPLAYSPKPRVICAPQGLTCYDSFGRIRYQWRWHELKNIGIARHPRCLYIEPRHGTPCTYRNSRLEYNDYTAIIAYAQRFIRASSFVLPPTQRINIATFDYYEDYVHNEHLYTAIAIIWATTVPVAICLPELPFSMLAWWDKWDDAPDRLFTYTYPLSVAIIIYASIKLLSLIGHIHLNLYNIKNPDKYLSIDCDGLHFIAKKKLTLYWHDIIDIYLDSSYSQGTIFYHIVITDRLANKREIELTPSYNQARHIMDTVKSIIEKSSSPSSTLDKPLDMTNNITPKYHKICYWVNAVFSIIIVTSTIQSKLDMNTIFVQNKNLFIISWSIMIFYFIIILPVFFSKGSGR